MWITDIVAGYSHLLYHVSLSKTQRFFDLISHLLSSLHRNPPTFAAASFSAKKMGTCVANKSRNPLVFVTVRVRHLIPFHVLYSTITPSTTSSSNGREYLEIPYQNRNQLLKSMRDHCKSRTFRNLDHALVLFDKMLHFKPFAFHCGFHSIFWCHCKNEALLSSHYSNWTNGIIRNCSQWLYSLCFD